LVFVALFALVVASCTAEDGTPTTAAALPGAESPELAVERFLAALVAEDWQATSPMVYEDQLALLASIEGVTPPETAAMLREGVPPVVRANFWSGFVEGFPVFAEQDVGEILIGSTEVFTVGGEQFGAVQVVFRYQPGAGAWVTRAEDGRWRVDMFATFGPSFANPLREWLETLPDDEDGRLIREMMAAQASSFEGALVYEPLGELPTEVKFEVRLLIVEANS
jgi:hypothetical protein